MAPQGNLLSFNTKQNKILHKTKMERSPVASGSILEHSNDRNDCKRPDISEPKHTSMEQIVFCRAYHAKKKTYLFTKKSIKTKLSLNRVNIRSTKYLFWL